jgi:glycosyltransferase involved in cell wall biosynthesis
MTLLVVVDATPYGPEPSGARRRAEELLPRLARLRPDAVFEVHWAADGGGPSPGCAADNLIHVTEDVSCRGGAWRLWKRRRSLGRRHRDAAFTHLLADHGPVVRPERVKNVITVHDLRFLHGYGGRARAWYGRHRYGAMLRRAAAVVAVSTAVRDELVETYGLSNVVVAANGVSAGFSLSARGRTRETLARFGLTPPYALVVGRDEPRKAMGAATAAWQSARATHSELELVVVGTMGPSSSGLFVLPRADDDELAALYAGASWTLVPSLYEGFSLPVVESLACGTPVITSDIPAHRAIVADGASGVVLVPPPTPVGQSFDWHGAADALRGARPAVVASPRSTWDDAAAVLARSL